MKETGYVKGITNPRSASLELQATVPD